LGFVKNVKGVLSFDRCEFFQNPSLWHQTKSYQIGVEKWSETKGQKHPIRPAARPGVVYKRYIPHLQKTVTFRLTNPEADLDVFHEWHNSFRVSFFWELNKPKEELKEYMLKGLQDPHQIPMFVELDGVPLGYYEMYWVAEDRLGPYYEVDAFDRGFHFLIGNKKFLGHSITDSVIKSGLHFLFLDDPRTRKIMAEPRSDNQKVLKYAEASIGWRKVKEFDFPHKRAALLECKREGFFEGNAL
jgi:RimJ/RimL family protein N-acetyltransferase